MYTKITLFFNLEEGDFLTTRVVYLICLLRPGYSCNHASWVVHSALIKATLSIFYGQQILAGRFIDRIALAKQEDNGIGSVPLSVRLCVIPVCALLLEPFDL